MSLFFLLDFRVFSGYLRDFRRRLLSSEKFSEAFTLKTFSGHDGYPSPLKLREKLKGNN